MHVQHCMVFAGTRNDQAREAKVTFTAREERNKAMAAGDSVLKGNFLRVRTWVCRPKENPKREFKTAARGKEGHVTPMPPGLGQRTQGTREEEDTEESQPEMKRKEAVAMTP